MKRTLKRLLPILCATALLPAADEPEQHGMDVIGAVKAVRAMLPAGEPAKDKPWAGDLAGITDPNPRVHGPAIRSLVLNAGRNPAVFDDLAVLAADRDANLRGRVLQVCAAVGGPAATPLLLRFSEDRERRIRELAALGLAQGSGDEALARLVAMLSSAPEAEIRQEAAASLGAFGDLRGLEPLTLQEREQDDLVKRAMRDSLTRLATDPRAPTQIAGLLGTLKDARRDALIEAVVDLHDPRLCPPLAAIAADPGRAGRSPEASAWTQFLAVRALAACGDWRAVTVLVDLADSEATGEVQRTAAEALRLITGFGAQPGKAWRVWQTDNAARSERLGRRDALLADLHDPAAPLDPAALGAWTVAELEPLVQAALGQPAGRITVAWSARSLAILRADDHARWIEPLAERIIAAPTADLDGRLGLILLLDELAPRDAIAPFTRVVKELKERMERELQQAKDTKSNPPDHGAEAELLKQALARRGVQAKV